jgi:release factor glutamine methyltransferase
MQTVRSVRAWALEELKRASIESPALTADLLIGFVLGWDRVRLLSRPEHEMDEEEWNRLRRLTHRRANGEPLQYLTGEQEFYGLAFKVTPAVLIPRPETEILVEKALDLIQSHASANARFADIGTGSGCIAVSVARHIPAVIGWAVDVSAVALKVAQENARRHSVEKQIRFVQSDLFECFAERPCFEFIFCNPPYVALDEYDSLPTEVKNHEPHQALFGGASGLDVYRRVVPQAAARLVAGGYLLLEAGAGQARQIGQFMEKAGLSLQPVLNDLQGIPRCLVGRK